MENVLRELSAIHLVMAADVEKYDLQVGYKQCQSNSVTVGEADGMASAEFSTQRMQLQSGLKRVELQFIDNFGKAGLEVGMFLEESAGLTEKLPWCGDTIHQSSSSESSAMSNSSAVANFFTRPALTSFNEALTRAR